MLYYIIIYYIMLYIILYYVILYYNILYYVILYYISLISSIIFCLCSRNIYLSLSISSSSFASELLFGHNFISN